MNRNEECGGILAGKVCFFPQIKEGSIYYKDNNELFYQFYRDSNRGEGVKCETQGISWPPLVGSVNLEISKEDLRRSPPVGISTEPSE